MDPCVWARFGVSCICLRIPRRYKIQHMYGGMLLVIRYEPYQKCRDLAGREANPTACVIDSQSVKSAEKSWQAHRSLRLRCRQEDQGEEAAYLGGYRRLSHACGGSSGRRPGARWRDTGPGDPMRAVSIFENALRGRRLPGAEILRGPGQGIAAAERWNRQTFGYGYGVQSSTQTLGSRTDCAWLSRCRRLAKDFDNRTRNALAFLRLASIRLMLRKLCSSNG
jgi:hypothetical protein